MRLLLVAALFICGTHAMSLGSECPTRNRDFHGRYTGAIRGTNKLATQTPRFGINSKIYDEYEPGETYEFELGKSEVSDEVRHMYFVSSALQENEDCLSLGSWQQLYPGGPQPREDCEHVLEYKSTTQLEGDNKFVWTAPECGCITISAVVVNQHGEYFTDDDDVIQGPLTMTLCPEEDDSVPSLYDDDFYGIDEEFNNEIDIMDEVTDEVTDIMTDALEDTDEVIDEDLTVEDTDDDEEDAYGRRKWRGRGRGKHGHGKGKGKGRGRQQDEDDEDAPGMRRGRGRGRNSQEEGAPRRRFMGRNSREEGEEYGPRGRRERKVAKGKFWRRKMGRRARSGEKSDADKAARLEQVCSRIEEKADEPIQFRSPRKTVLTEEALEIRRERWATFRQDMLVCCEEMTDEELVQCFKDAHGRRIAQKMCEAEQVHFKAGEIPEKIQAAQEKCCESEGQEQKECLMDAHKVMKKMKRHVKRKFNNETRVEAICKRVEKHPLPPKKQLSKLPIVQKNRWTTLFTERRLQMSECCKLASDEQESCVADLREQRLDRVCQGEEELTPPWSRKADDTEEITEECCVLEGTERYQCFGQKMPHRGPKGARRAHRRRGPKDSEEIMDEEENSRERKPARRPNKNMMSRRERVARHKSRRHSRVCCQGGRSAGNQLEELTQSKWRTCQEEAKGYIVDREEAKTDTQHCIKSFRKCCVHSVIRKAREEAVEKAEEEEDLIEEDLTVEL